MPKTIISDAVRFRYEEAYRKYQAKAYASATQSFGFLPTKYPDTRTANGLTQFVLNFLKWNGWRATRISSAGSFRGGRYVYSQTRRGTADISATIQGRAVMLEIKVGSDRPSVYQLKEQERERNSGGVYEFIRDPEQFILWYDNYISSIK